MSDNPRYTQFLEFAKLLYEELAQNAANSVGQITRIEAFKREQETIIAQRVYDLVKMQKHEDGSVTLSKEEFAELRDTYLAIRKKAFGAHMGHEQYLKSVKWREILSGNEFGEKEEKELLIRIGDMPPEE